jgi:hypothetical protein
MKGQSRNWKTNYIKVLNMNKYLIDLALAFQKVKIDFYSFEALNNNGDYTQEAENNFSSEIIRHFRNLIEEPINQIYYQSLVCHFDVNKQRFRMKPDIVLHNAPNNQLRQEFFCEVKIDSDAQLKDDLEKLLIAISSNLNFRYGIMLVANKSLENTLVSIRDFKKSEININWEKLYLFHSIPNGNGTLSFSYLSFQNI